MLLASLALGAVLLAAGLIALAVRSWLAALRELVLARRMELRHRAWTAERARFLAIRTSIAEKTTNTTDAVQLGSTIAQAGHQAIADIPFSVLGAIPATRRRSKLVRDIHDGIADTVYGTISAVSGGVGEVSRKMLVGDTIKLEDEVGSDPPEPPTSPAHLPG
jgi:hypothetical protein